MGNGRWQNNRVLLFAICDYLRFAVQDAFFSLLVADVVAAATAASVSAVAATAVAATTVAVTVVGVAVAAAIAVVAGPAATAVAAPVPVVAIAVAAATATALTGPGPAAASTAWISRSATRIAGPGISGAWRTGQVRGRHSGADGLIGPFDVPPDRAKDYERGNGNRRRKQGVLDEILAVGAAEESFDVFQHGN
jgi:hypothetical protein